MASSRSHIKSALRGFADGVSTSQPEDQQPTATTEKEELIGKVEAALWMKGQEVPIGLPMKNTTELRAILKKLKRAAE